MSLDGLLHFPRLDADVSLGNSRTAVLEELLYQGDVVVAVLIDFGGIVLPETVGADIPIPKDLTKVKTKVAFNLTKRQLVCFGGGALLGVPLFFLLRGSAGNSTAALCMMFVMLPFFLLAMYEKHGQPLEKIVGNIIRVTVIRPRQRPYRTNNFYAVLQRQANLDEEVSHIVYGNQKLAAPAVRKKRGKSCAAGQNKEKAVPRRQKAD